MEFSHFLMQRRHLQPLGLWPVWIGKSFEMNRIMGKRFAEMSMVLIKPGIFAML